MSIRSRLNIQERRDTLTVSRRTWHGRLYHFWRDHSKFKNSSRYRENLCHYMRVILFWGPISVFIRWHPKRLPDFVTPMFTFFSLLALGSFGYTMYTRPLDTLEVVGVVLGTVLVLFLALLGSVYISDHIEDIKEWWVWEGTAVKPLKAVGRFFRAIGRFIATVFGAIYRFLDRKVLKLPVGGWIAIAIWLGACFIDISVLWSTLIGLAVLALLSILGTIGYKIYEEVRELTRHRRYVKTVTKEEGIISVGFRYAAAKKGRICPFIEVVN
jgi:hypothetical protein